MVEVGDQKYNSVTGEGQAEPNLTPNSAHNASAQDDNGSNDLANDNASSEESYSSRDASPTKTSYSGPRRSRSRPPSPEEG